MRRVFISGAVEFGPVLLFLSVYVFTDFFTAVGFAVAAVFVAVGYALFEQNRIAWFPIVTLLSTLAFGGASLVFKNESFYILQDTVGSFVFSALFFWSVWRGRPILKTWFHHTFAISDTGWRMLTWRWAFFFLVMGSANELVRLTQTPETWVLFKLGTTTAILLFGLYQFRVSIRERIVSESNRLGLRTSPIHISSGE